MTFEGRLEEAGVRQEGRVLPVEEQPGALERESRQEEVPRTLTALAHRGLPRGLAGVCRPACRCSFHFAAVPVSWMLAEHFGCPLHSRKSCWNPCKPSYQFSAGPSSVQLSRVPLCDPIDCSTPGLSVHHQLPEFTQTRPLSQ